MSNPLIPYKFGRKNYTSHDIQSRAGVTYLPNGNFEKTGQGFSVKTGQNTVQNFRALPWMPSEVPFARDKSIGILRDVEIRGVNL